MSLSRHIQSNKLASVPQQRVALPTAGRPVGARLDPIAALSAMTIEPARAFHIDDRVGSLKRGKDADFVVFDGSPFEITSRPLLVVCNGRVVHDARPTAEEDE